MLSVALSADCVAMFIPICKQQRRTSYNFIHMVHTAHCWIWNWKVQGKLIRKLEFLYSVCKSYCFKDSELPVGWHKRVGCIGRSVCKMIAFPYPLLAPSQVKKSRREEAVLYDVFPRHIADALVAGRKVRLFSQKHVSIFLIVYV